MSNNSFNGVVSLEYIVALVQVDLSDYGDSAKKKVLQYAINGLKELNLFVLKSMNVEYLKVNDDKTVDLPLDYIYYQKIGVDCGNGQIWTLTLNEDLVQPKADTTSICKPETVVPPTGNTELGFLYGGYGYPFYHHFRGGQYVGEMFGLGGGLNVGEFKVDDTNRKILFGSEMPFTEIILEYKSSGIKPGGDTKVPQEAVDTIRKYIHWQLNEYDPSAPMGEKDRKRLQYGDAYNKLQYLTNLFTKDEYLDMVWANASLTVNRG